MWNDSETNSDFIDYQHHVTAVTKIINTDALLPCSIGIFGDWGSGKSSLMKMISDRYIKDKDCLVIKFNGWLFEGYEDAKTVLMGRIIDEIIRNRTLEEKGKELVKKLLKRIDFIKLGGTAVKYGLGIAAGGPIGLATLTLADAVKGLKDFDYDSYIKESSENKDVSLRNNIQGFHSNFEELITETKIKKIIVLIDDLDRCTPDTIIGTLEAIKLFLFTKNTAFIIGADERLIKYAVRRRFPEIPGESAEVGRDYLEKLIQYPIRIPPLNSTELETYINLLFTRIYLEGAKFEPLRDAVMKAKINKGFNSAFNIGNVQEFIQDTLSDELKEALSLSAQINPILSIGLNGNPRQTKRFLNTLLIRHEMAKSKKVALKKKVLAKLMLLEYFKPETFKLFYSLQAKNNGIAKGIDILEGVAKKPLAGANSHAKTQDNDSEPEIEALLQDEWFRDWLASEPSLKDENLQPYYYFSRDRLTISGGLIQRMSSAAQEVFRKLMNDAQSVQNNALKDVKGLSPSDASAIFEALTEKALQEEMPADPTKSAIKKLIDFTKERAELISQLMIFIEKLPEQNIPITIVPWLEGLTKGTTFTNNIDKLVAKWSNSVTNTSLAKICKAKLKK